MPGSRLSTVRGGAALLAAAFLVPACVGVLASPTEPDRQRVGILRSVVDEDHSAFVDELRVQGWQPGREVVLLPEDPTQVYTDPEAARQQLRDWQDEGELDLVVAFSTPHAQAAAEELPDVPTLFVVNDPVAGGLVTDRRSPEGMLTGLSFRTPADRTLHLASRAMGGIDRIGYLWPEDDTAVPGHREAVEVAAEELGVEVVSASFRDADTIAEAAEGFVSADVDAVWLTSSNTTLQFIDDLEHHLNEQRLPTIANTDHAGFAVVIVTPDGEQLRRQLARQAGRLLAGTPVSSVPVEDPRRFVLIINATMADELGLPPIDASLLRQADLVR